MFSRLPRLSPSVSLSPTERRTLRHIARYQFGPEAGPGLFPSDETPEVRRGADGHPRQVIDETGRLVTVGQDGRLTIGFAGGRRLQRALGPPAARVAVGDESDPYVRAGKNAFGKFVQSVDPEIRGGDEVLVVHADDDTLLGVGRAELPAAAMRDLQTGMAVQLREGRDKWADRT